MKKNILFFVIVMALGLTSCIFNGGGGSNNGSTTKADVAILDNGKISFYDATGKKLTPYEKELDSVVNILFTDRDHLYYTVAKDGNVSLKMIDVSAKDAEPVFCADWNLTLDNAIDYITGGTSKIYFDTYGNNIIIYGFDPEQGYPCPFAYGIDSHKVKKLDDEEYFCVYYDDFNESRFFSENRLFYYAAPQGKACLNDKIDFEPFFNDKDELNDLEFGIASLSPDGKKALYTAAVYWGEGWGYYCVANTDGTAQEVLGDSDLYHGQPAWLADGSLVYVGEAPLPENDPDYDADYNTTQPCIKLVDAQKNTTTIAMGRSFDVRPFASHDNNKVSQEPLEGCDAAIFENGKVTFYNSTKDKFVPFAIEQDSVINGVFNDDNCFYYTVAIGGELYLKEIYLSEYQTAPLMLTAWDLTLDDCISETYGKTSDLILTPKMSCVGISYDFNWDYYNFSDIRFYNYENHTKKDGWSEEDDESDIYDESFLEYDLGLEKINVEDNKLFFNNGEEWACISDKINFRDYVSDPEEYSDPDFIFYSIDPTYNYIAYAGLIEWGDLGHGPLCLASIDGEVQMAFKGTDAANLTWGWLAGGSLLYVDEESSCIMIVKPGKTPEVFANTSMFVVKEY